MINANISHLSTMSLFKIDIKSAYRCIPVRPADYHLLGLIHNNKVFFDAVLTFGLSSSCGIFETFSTAANWIAEDRIPELKSKLIHYIDDFLGLCIGSPAAASASLSKLLFLMELLGFPIPPDKIEGPARTILFLGIAIDLVNMLVRLDQTKLLATQALVADWLNRSHCSYNDIESLAGSLYWVTRVVRGGRTFLRRVVDAQKERTVRGPLPIEPEIRADLQWWSRFIATYNGRSILPESKWTSNDTPNCWTLSTDACGTGYGARWNSCYLYGTWSPSQLALTKREHGIAISTLELAAIVIATKTWGSNWKGKRILFECDNEAAVSAINSESCPNPLMMELTRELWYLCCAFDFEIRAVHLPGLLNVDADNLSRGAIDLFLQTHPGVTFSRSIPLQPECLR